MAHRSILTIKRLAIGATLAMALSATAACGSDNGSSDKPSSGETTKGTITFGTDPTYPPYEYKENGEIVGFEADYARAIAKALDKEAKFVEVKYTTGIGALQAKRFDALLLGGTLDGPERQKEVLLVDLFKASTGLLVQKGNPKNLSSYSTLCGNKVVTFAGTSMIPLLEGANKEKCANNPIDILTLSDANGPYTAVQSGRADAYLGDYFQALYEAPLFDGEAVKLTDAESYPAAFPVRKDNLAMAQELARGLQKVIDSGEMANIAKKYGIPESELVETVTINNGSVPVS